MIAKKKSARKAKKKKKGGGLCICVHNGEALPIPVEESELAGILEEMREEDSDISPGDVIIFVPLSAGTKYKVKLALEKEEDKT